MLNFFAASGHINYAKCTTLYFQQMLELEDTHPWLYHKFIDGFHAVRRSDSYWAELWSDLVIEQTLKRSIKSRVGLTRGRGINESVRHLWVLSLNAVASINHATTDLCGLAVNSSQQHVDLGQTRRCKNQSDCQKFVQWQERNPFLFEDEHLHSLSIGLVSIGIDSVNCENSEEVGLLMQKQLNQVKMPKCKIRRTDQVQSLITLQHSFKVDRNQYCLIQQLYLSD